MNRKVLAICAIMLASPFTSWAAPVTFKEISMLLRNGESQQFIFSEAEKRKLLQPLSNQEETTLTGLGASPALLTALRSPTLLAPPDVVEAYKARLRKMQETPPPAPSAPPDQAQRTAAAPANAQNGGNAVLAGVAAARNAAPIAIFSDYAYSLSQLDDAKAKARSEKKPIGFVMVWGKFFGKKSDPREKGSIPAFAHFYQAFRDTLVLVFVRHESELEAVPEAVKEGFSGPDEGGFAPNMAVVDASATRFIVEIPMGGADGDGPARDQVFANGAAKIDRWLTDHPGAAAP